MTITEVTGDLFDPDLKLPAIGHGVNCRGVMGAGIAAVFRQRFPAMYGEYRRRCHAGLVRPGDIMPWAEHGMVVYNLATQDLPGPDARLDAVYASVRRMLTDAELREIPVVGLPRIGAGIGGLHWDDVQREISRAQHGSPVGIAIVTLPDKTWPA